MLRFDVRHTTFRDTGHRFSQRSFVSATSFHLICFPPGSRVTRVNGDDSHHAIIRDVQLSRQIASLSERVRSRANSDEAGLYHAKDNEPFESAFASGLGDVLDILYLFLHLFVINGEYFMVFFKSGPLFVRLFVPLRNDASLFRISLHRPCAQFNAVRLGRFEGGLSADGSLPFFRRLSDFFRRFKSSAQRLQFSGSFVAEFSLSNHRNLHLGHIAYENGRLVRNGSELHFLPRRVRDTSGDGSRGCRGSSPRSFFCSAVLRGCAFLLVSGKGVCSLCMSAGCGSWV